jgi:hypothetical protein
MTAVREWAVSKLTDDLRAAGEPTTIIGHLDLDTGCVQFRPLDHDAEYLAMVIDADTENGGHFHHVIAWNPAASRTQPYRSCS